MNESIERRGEATPAVMPVDREAWFDAVNLSMFVNTYYQLRDVRHWVGAGKTILIIGPGQGLDAAVFRWKQYEVTTFDIDSTFDPDVIGSCHDMPMFRDKHFDIVIVSHVLEHLPIAYLNGALAEIARVGHFALAYLPVAGRHPRVTLDMGFKSIELTAVADLFNPLRKPDPGRPLFCSGQHYWEIGYRGFSKRAVRERLAHHFEVLTEYRNKHWTPSYNFVLRSRR
ncbi:methyltransferase domain-containing protein [Steroidobacter cummioxidans]|uniref:methyltransferase domain-containing protein n=1 Tax=Steroidobacter cummioxidans TaxID=1803913 RepID=UPI000E3110BD|nr:methyltransferase domain-containing protein [Steroidobacter cummioxidans]